jgi:putative transcriptional regulator
MLARRKMRLIVLAERVGITPQNLSVLKTGKARAIRFSTLEKLCEVLDCQPGDLFAFSRLRRSSSKLPDRLPDAPKRRLPACLDDKCFLEYFSANKNYFIGAARDLLTAGRRRCSSPI